jgi:hypothetical protein
MFPLRLTRLAAPLLALGLSVGAVAASSATFTASAAPAAQSASTELPAGIAARLSLHTAMDKLWEDHITWTRLYIVDALGDSPELPQTTQRLLQNQVDIGNAIKPFYGEDAGNQLTALLNSHILIAADVVGAARKGDTAALNESMARWQANANDIADFLAAANPDNWPQDEMRSMMRQHLDLTTQEAVAHLSKDWAGDVAAYDKVHEHILMLSDGLTQGIINQFPDQFSA